MKSQYSTREAAKKLGIAHVTLQKHVALETFAPPPIVKVGGVSVRLWTEADIRRAQKALAAAPKPGRKKKT
jgi:predicted DNA-binding transcriptional regulator AlpA